MLKNFFLQRTFQFVMITYSVLHCQMFSPYFHPNWYGWDPRERLRSTKIKLVLKRLSDLYTQVFYISPSVSNGAKKLCNICPRLFSSRTTFPCTSNTSSPGMFTILHSQYVLQMGTRGYSVSLH
jgi:hypothetical protein